MTINFQQLQEDAAATRQMLTRLLERLDNLPFSEANQPTDDIPLTAKQAATYLGVSLQTVYQNRASIPHRKRHGKLYFYRHELADYLNRGV